MPSSITEFNSIFFFPNWLKILVVFKKRKCLEIVIYNFKTRDCSLTRSTSAFRRVCDGVDSRLKPCKRGKDVISCTYCCYVRYATSIIFMSGGMPWPNTLPCTIRIPDKGRAIKGLIVCCNGWDLEPLDLPKGLALGCYPPSPKVWFVPNNKIVDR